MFLIVYDNSPPIFHFSPQSIGRNRRVEENRKKGQLLEFSADLNCLTSLPPEAKPAEDNESVVEQVALEAVKPDPSPKNQNKDVQDETEDRNDVCDLDGEVKKPESVSTSHGGDHLTAKALADLQEEVKTLNRRLSGIHPQQSQHMPPPEPVSNPADKLKLDEQAAQIMSLTAAKRNFEEVNHRLSQDIEKMEMKMSSEIQQLVAEKRQLESQVKDLELSHKKVTEQLEKSQEKMDALENHALPQSNAKLQQALGQIDVYKKELEEKKSTISQYECDIDKLKRRNEATVREMKENEVEFQSLISQGAEMHSFLEDEVKRKNGIISQLEGTVTSLKKMIEKEEVRALDFKAKFESTLKELEAANETQHQLENKLSQAEEQLQKDAEFKEEVIHKNKKSSASVKAMEKDRQNLNERLKQIEIELAKTREERDHAIIRLGTSDKREDELFEKLLESDRVRRELHARVMYLSGNIRVFVRVRPPIPGEEENCTEDDKHFRFGGNGGLTGQINTKYGSDDPTKNLLEVIEPKKDRGGLSERRKKWTFGFDQIYDPSCDQRDVWEGCEPLIQSAIDGFNVTIFAYGQTGSGKTYTMLGDSTRSDSEGIISRAVRKLFDSKAKIEELSRGEKQVFLSVELLEIYNENVRDLLSASKQDTFLKIVANEAVGSTHLPVNSEMDVFKVLEMAQKRRCVKATASNATSSRSHMLFTIVFNVQSKDGTAQTGKLHVCDLAGSERLGKSGANNVGGALLNETKHINLSLSTLSNVIEKLQAGDSNVPFRESKLTSLLQNSLGGNSKTLCIVCANPLQAHFHETLCSLRFAAKINKVDLKAQQNFSA